MNFLFANQFTLVNWKHGFRCDNTKPHTRYRGRQRGRESRHAGLHRKERVNMVSIFSFNLGWKNNILKKASLWTRMYRTNWENNINKMTSNYNWGLAWLLLCFVLFRVSVLCHIPSLSLILQWCRSCKAFHNIFLVTAAATTVVVVVVVERFFVWHLSPSAHFRLKWKWNQQGNWGRFRDI